MTTRFSQQDRQGRLSTVLEQDTLVLLRMDGTEELSGDFEWRVEALSTRDGLDLEAMLGTHATVQIDHATGTRAFSGIVCEAGHRGRVENGWRYDLFLRPWLHVAELRRNMRIFHNKTVVQIVEETLSAYSGLGNPHLDVQLTGDYPVLEYTVQYGESDADFVRRQLERHGISWSWRHERSSHTLLLTDMELSLPAVPGKSRPYYGVEGYHRAEEEHFRTWSSGQRITTGAVRLTEYNFKTPNVAQEVDQMGDAAHPNGDIESFDWPGDYLNQGEGSGVVHRRLQAERGQAPRHQAEGDVISLGAGWRVTLAGDEVPEATGRTFVCLKAQHRFRAQAYGSGDAGNDETPYEGSYVLTPDDTPYRPERRQRGPRVEGPETAVVVGEGEIDCDEHGRILVRFHWDRDAAHSMRVRVSQNWASKGWGGMIIPRIGMEVIVEHLRGDPDKPIVTGCVYNGKNVPPYELPTHKTRSTFKTDTHQGTGFNELTFEDALADEEIYMHAARDMNVHTTKHRSELTDENWSVKTGGSKSEIVDRGSRLDVRGGYHIFVGANQKTTRTRTVDPIWPTFKGMGYRMDELRYADTTAPGDFEVDAESGLQLSSGQSMSLNSADDIALTSSSHSVWTAMKRMTLEAGRLLTIVAKNRLALRADKSISISNRNASINIDEEGNIVVRAASLRVESHGKVKIFGSTIHLNGE